LPVDGEWVRHILGLGRDGYYYGGLRGKYGIQGEASYRVFRDGDYTKARNGRTGEIEFSDEDASTVIQSAIDASPAGGVVEISDGDYTANISISKNLTLRGMHPYGTNLMPSEASTELITASTCKVHIENLHLVLTGWSGRGIYLNGVDRGLVRNIRIDGGGYGIYLANTGSTTFENIAIANASAGVYVDGDGGGENRFSNVDIFAEATHTMGTAFELHRTTTTDTGGLHLYFLKVGNLGNMSCGFKAVSEAASLTGVFIRAINCVFDNINQGNAVELVNVGHVDFVDPWFTSSQYGVRIKDSNFVSIHGGYIASGSAYSDVYIENNAESIILSSVFLTNSGTNIHLDTAGTKGNIWVHGCRYLGTLTDHPEILSSANQAAQFTHGLHVLVRGDQGTDQTFTLEEGRTTTPNRRKYLRIGSSGDLQVLDNAWSKELLNLTEAGRLSVYGNIRSSVGSVKAKVKAGAPSDADFPEAEDGLVVADTTNNRIWVRVGGVWRYAALT
jgi:hypothetical protein